MMDDDTTALTGTYTFTYEQLDNLLGQTIELFIEYQETHGHDQSGARWEAVNETMTGLDAERELWARGEIQHPSQVLT
jgi:hypothetical protein